MNIAFTSGIARIGTTAYAQTRLASQTAKPADATPESTADKISLSNTAQALLAREQSSALPVPGQAQSLMEYAEAYTNASGRAVMFKLTDAQVAEMRLYDQQMKSREAANLSYAQSHRYATVGQVFANGKLVASVNDAGGYSLNRNIPGLSAASLSPSERLAEIAQAVNGEVRTSGFVPTGGWSGPGAPESALPPVTARSMQEILEQDIFPLFRQGESL